MKRALNVLLIGMVFQKLTQLSQILVQAAVEDGVPVTAVQQDFITTCINPARHYLRFGVSDCGARIESGDVDILLGVDLYEAARIGADYLADGGVLIVNSRVVPRPIEGKWGRLAPELQEKLLGLLRSIASKVIVLDAAELADHAGDAQLVRFAMLGALCGSGVLPLQVETVEKVLSETVMELEREAAVKAFRAALQQVQTA